MEISALKKNLTRLYRFDGSPPLFPGIFAGHRGLYQGTASAVPPEANKEAALAAAAGCQGLEATVSRCHSLSARLKAVP
jgi:hypothetical protein